MSTSVIVSGALMREALTKAGFVHNASLENGREEVWSFTHKRDDRYLVVVYTSLTIGAESTRGCGEDAIRVIVLEAARNRWPVRHFPIWKSKRVFRTGTEQGVIDHMLERAREGYAFINVKLNGKGKTS